MGWFALSLGVALVTLVLTFGIMARKAYKRIGELETENETLKEQLALSAGKLARALLARPTVDRLRSVVGRLSGIRPEDN
jgi:hypothetical protein